MALRSKRAFERLNRARLDSRTLAASRDRILTSFRAVHVAHKIWIESEEPEVIRVASQAFIDLLGDLFYVGTKRLSLGNRCRPHSRDAQGRIRGELHGTCSSKGTIRIYLRTAAREQPTAFKTYFNTLVHEWVHHYDFVSFNDSIHCGGFYQRLNSIYKMCVETLPSAKTGVRRKTAKTGARVASKRGGSKKKVGVKKTRKKTAVTKKSAAPSKAGAKPGGKGTATSAKPGADSGSKGASKNKPPAKHPTSMGRSPTPGRGTSGSPSRSPAPARGLVQGLLDFARSLSERKPS